MYVILLFLLAFLSFRYLNGKNGLLDFEHNLSQFHLLQEKVKKKRLENSLVKYDILSLKTQSDLYEEKARDKYNMISEGEILFILPKKDN